MIKVSDAMTPRLETIDAEAPIQEAAAKMKDGGIGALAVIEGGQLTGFLTDRDIATRFVAEGLDYSGTTVSDVMTRDVIACRKDDDVSAALRTMKTRRIRRLVVLDARGRPAGIISTADIEAAREREEVDHHETPRGQGRPQFPGPG